MTKTIVHLPTEQDEARRRMGLRQSLQDVASDIAGQRTREMYGCASGTMELDIPSKP